MTMCTVKLEIVAQSSAIVGKVLAYQTAGNHECSLNYYGPELFRSGDFVFIKKLSRVILRRWMLLASGKDGNLGGRAVWIPCVKRILPREVQTLPFAREEPFTEARPKSRCFGFMQENLKSVEHRNSLK